MRRWRRVRRSVRHNEVFIVAVAGGASVLPSRSRRFPLLLLSGCASASLPPFPGFHVLEEGRNIRVCSSQRAAVLGKGKKKRGVECEDGACGTSHEAGPAHAAGGDEDTEHTGTDVGRTTRSQRTGWNTRVLFEPT